MASGLGVNGSQEQTWYTSKDDSYKLFEKQFLGLIVLNEFVCNT
jgi:hypothetical protein